MGTIRPYLALIVDVIASKSGPEVTSSTVPVTGVMPAMTRPRTSLGCSVNLGLLFRSRLILPEAEEVERPTRPPSTGTIQVARTRRRVPARREPLPSGQAVAGCRPGRRARDGTARREAAAARRTPSLRAFPRTVKRTEGCPLNLTDLRASVRHARHHSQAQLEASGGLRLDTARAAAETGVHYIAVGARTHSSPALDLGLDMVTPG